MAVEIAPNERVLFVGKTGSGKSYAAKLLASRLARLVVVDTKGGVEQSDPANWPGMLPWDREGRRRLNEGYAARLLVRPAIGEDLEPIFRAVYEAGNAVIYLDEMYGVLPPGSRPGPWLSALYTRGRGRGIGVWAASQRPIWIPVFAKSEADWFLLFRLQDADDRRHMVGYMGEEASRVLRGHQVLVYHQSWDEARLYRQMEARTVRVGGYQGVRSEHGGRAAERL